VQFQAVQQSLAELAAEAAAAAASCEAAIAAAEGPRGAVLIAVTKARASQAAGTGARIAHQLHGAIGISQEHALPRYTRALWSWRDEYGSEYAWGSYLASSFAERGEGQLWAWVVGD
jgi:acyl-CoA dehydrogenase